MQQYNDNLRWLKEAEKHRMVVGSQVKINVSMTTKTFNRSIFQARILYSDQEGRAALAKAFNRAVAKGEIRVMLHHKILCKKKEIKALSLEVFNLDLRSYSGHTRANLRPTTFRMNSAPILGIHIMRITTTGVMCMTKQRNF